MNLIETMNNYISSLLSGSQAQTVLVDTSLLIEQLKRNKYAVPVIEALSPYRFKGASSYSKLEFKRAWLQRFAYIHGICQKSNIKSVSDVLDHINKRLGSHPAQNRRLQTCLEMLSHFFELNSKTVSEGAQLARLRAHAKRCAIDGIANFKKLVNEEFNGTKCARAEEAVTENPDGSLNAVISKCKSSNIVCAVHHFFEQNSKWFESIAGYIDTHPDVSDELKRMNEHIKKAMNYPSHLCDDKHCRKLADALIAIDGIKMDIFAANNNAEWKPIAEVLGKELLNPVRSC